MKSLPDGLTPYSRSSTFTEESIPANLLADHKTKAGVWGVITVLSGRLIYTIPSDAEEIVLDPDNFGVVEPTKPHHVGADGPVSFYVEFYR